MRSELEGETADGALVEDVVLEAVGPPYEFSGTVAKLNDGLIALRTHDVAGPDSKDGHAASVWMSAWGLPQPELEALGERWKKLLDELSASGA
jgi:hypothetical protein